eukprot:2273925-Rhodomonas_salina.1
MSRSEPRAALGMRGQTKGCSDPQRSGAVGAFEPGRRAGSDGKLQDVGVGEDQKQRVGVRQNGEQ